MQSDESEYPLDAVSFYIYGLKFIEENNFTIDFIYPANLYKKYAELNNVYNWTYERIEHETEKAYLLVGINSDNKPRWIAKSLLELGENLILTKNNYYGHRGYIREKHPNFNIS